MEGTAGEDDVDRAWKRGRQLGRWARPVQATRASLASRRKRRGSLSHLEE
jgi:hypothetical protein